MKYQVAATDNGLQFLVTRSNGKVEALPGDFAFVAPLDTEHSLDVLKKEVSGRGTVTRAALSSLYAILQSPRMDGYKGQGNINGTDGTERLPKEIKTAMRDAESAFFTPMFKDTKKLDQFLTGIRDAGIYATVKGVALKYFWFAGKLPSLYEGDNPRPEKLLSVSAMQKLLANMEDKQEKDDSIAARVLMLDTEFRDTTDITRDQMVVLRRNLLMFAENVQQSINVLDAEATEKTENILPQGAVVAPEVDADAIMKAWADMEAKQEAAKAVEEEALF
mgnify:CR=1 FL=1